MYALALVSGLTDVDAITLSSLRLFSLDRLGGLETVTAIALAVAANLGFKAGMAAAVGGGGLARITLPGMAAVGVGLALGWGLFSFQAG